MPKLINSGIYILELKAGSGLKIIHPKFINYYFQKGYYYYVGSAQKNLIQRLKRHSKKDKKKHWHIDYLTTHNNIRILRIFLIPHLKKKSECILVGKLIKNTELNIVVENFGNSDCNNCRSHLLYSKTKMDYNQLLALYHSTVLFIPSSKLIS